jgi:hypothetical protein
VDPDYEAVSVRAEIYMDTESSESEKKRRGAGWWLTAGASLVAILAYLGINLPWNDSPPPTSPPPASTVAKAKYEKLVEDSNSAMDFYLFLIDQSGQTVALDVAFGLDIAKLEDPIQKDVLSTVRIMVDCADVEQGRKKEECQYLLGDGPYFDVNVYNPPPGVENPFHGEVGVATTLRGCFVIDQVEGEYGNDHFMKPIGLEKCTS